MDNIKMDVNVLKEAITEGLEATLTEGTLDSPILTNPKESCHNKPKKENTNIIPKGT
jgi:hypothetical protein